MKPEHTHRKNSLASWLHSCLSAMLTLASVHGATVVWDADTSNSSDQDGGGIWSSTHTNWLDASSNNAWLNTTPPNSAVIGASNGAAGTIQVTESIQLQNLTFQPASSGEYTITSTGSGSLNLASDSVIETNVNATIQSAIASTTGFTKTGAGILKFSGTTSNIITGTTILEEGRLEIGKTSGAKSIGGTIEVLAGAELVWGYHDQFAAGTHLVIDGGHFAFSNRSETMASFTQTSGGMLTGTIGSNTGVITVEGTFRMSGGDVLTLNSGATLHAQTIDLRGYTSSTQAFNLGGSNVDRITAISVGSGGLYMDGQRIQLNYATSDTSLGSQLILGGNLIASNTNIFSSNASTPIYDQAVSRVDLGSAERTFQIISGDTTFNQVVSIIGTGGLKKTGEGNLIFGMAANSNAVDVGTIKVEEGILRTTQNEVLSDDTQLQLSGGKIEFTGKTETVNSVTITGGEIVSGNNARIFITEDLDIQNNGKLSLNSGTIISSSSLTLQSLSSLVIGAASTTQTTQIVVGSGGLTLNGQNIAITRVTTEGQLGSEIILNGNLISSGTSSIKVGISGTLATSAKAHLKIEGANRQINVTDTLTISAPIYGTTSLIKTGLGTLVFEGNLANTYQGHLTLQEGQITLGKAENVNSINGDLTLNGGTLLFSQHHQLNDETDLVQNGGFINFNSKNETFKSFTKLDGDINSTGGTITITGTFKGIGGISLGSSTAAIYSMNSGGQTSAYEVDFSESVKSNAILLGGNSTRMTRLTVGAGGLKINNNTLTFNRENVGSELALNGDVRATGNNTFNQGAAGIPGTSVAQIHHGTGTRTWEIVSGTTTSNLPVVSSGGGLTKAGAGTLVLNGINTYTGKTTVSAGSLQVGSAGGFSDSPWFEVGSGATLNVSALSTGLILNQSPSTILSGSGNITGSVTLADGASVRPGMSSNPEAKATAGSETGTLTISGNLNATQGAANTVGVLNIKSAASADKIEISGYLTLNQNSNIQVLFDPEFDDYQYGDSWTLIDWSGSLYSTGFDIGENGRTGNDALANEGNLDLPTLGGDFFWDISSLTADSHLRITIAPEPTRALLLLTALGSLALRRRRSCLIDS